MQLTEKARQRRSYILEGNLWKVILFLSTPLAIYGLFNYLYGFFDLVLVSTIGSHEVASVVFIDEIKSAIMAFGGGIAVGGTVIVARFYGAGQIDQARKHASIAFVLAFLVSSLVVILALVFGRQLLMLLNAPEEVIETGLGYFYIQMGSTALMAVNSVFIGLEKAKGNTTSILILNIVAMTIKLILSLYFVFIMHEGTTYVALATLISQGLLMVIALFVMFGKNNPFQMRLHEIKLKGAYIFPILAISIPVFTGKFLFSFGKVLVNSMAAVYGPLAVAAFGIAMKLGGAPGSISLVFEESEISIVSQNLGNRRLDRAMKTFYISHIYAFVVALIGMLLINHYMDQLLPIFTQNQDSLFVNMIKDIYFWEKFSTLTSTSIAIITGLFIGFKYSKIALLLNIARLFIFRLPLLWVLQYMHVGYVALGYVMFYSNLATMILAMIIFLIFYHRTHSFGYMDMELHPKTR
jgi:putative MATE family efflux protein